MNNIIEESIRKNGNLKLMTHVVAGYPDIKTNIEVINTMALSGADLIEIQIPFSDPIADGPTIMKANSGALDKKFDLKNYFDLIKKIRKEIKIPLLAMTYANIPFNFGMENFIRECSAVGLDGTIIPDLPFDEENEDYIGIAARNNIHVIQVVSPGMDNDRLKKILSKASGFVYTTLKVGITGATNWINRKGLEFPELIRSYTALPIAAGFGIASPEHIKQLKGKIDIAIIGSHIIDIFEDHGLNGIRDFIKECKNVCGGKP